MDRKTREELNTLSKECFGTSSRWQKIMLHGVAEPFERDREVMVPTAKGVEKKVFTDKKNVIKHFSLNEVRKLMEDLLEDRRKQIVDLAKAQDNNTLVINPTDHKNVLENLNTEKPVALVNQTEYDNLQKLQQT